MVSNRRWRYFISSTQRIEPEQAIVHAKPQASVGTLNGAGQRTQLGREPRQTLPSPIALAPHLIAGGSLTELNQAIAELLVRLNDQPFRKREGCRRTLFDQLDRPALRPLPAERYQYGDWETHRVNIDYHVAFDHHWYSVPYQLVHQEVEVRAAAATVEIFHPGQRVANHVRSHKRHAATTVDTHPRRTSGTSSGRRPAWWTGPPKLVLPPPLCLRRSWPANATPSKDTGPAWGSCDSATKIEGISHQ